MSRKIKVVHVINSLSAGGAEIFVTALSVALAKSKCDITVIAYAGTLDSKGLTLEMKLLEAGVEYIPLNIKSKFLKIALPIKLINIFMKIKPDIIHSHLVHSDFLVVTSNLLVFKKYKIVRTIHSMFAAKVFPESIESWLDKSFNKNIACSSAVFEVYPYLKFNRAVIDNGIELPSFLDNLQINKIRISLGLEGTTKLFLCVGSFSTRGNQLPKSQDIIIKSLVNIVNLDFKICFLGQGERFEEIKQLAKDFNVFHKCLFLGSVNNPLDYINAADCIVQPSRFEGLSLACIESVCLGKPLILTNIKASEPFFKKSTLLCDVGDYIGLADNMREYLNNNYFYNKLAIAEVDSYRNKFDIKHVALNYFKLYESLLN